VKVFEILDPKKFEPKEIEEPSIDKFNKLNRGEDDRYGNRGESPGIKRLGSGLFGTAYATHEEPGTAHKVVRPTRNLEQDGYYQYMKMLASHAEGSNNRFFPKVYDIEVFKSPNQADNWQNAPYTYKVEMERLKPLKDLSTEELVQIGDRLFSDFQSMISSHNNTRNSLRHDTQLRNKLGFGKRDRAEQESLRFRKQKPEYGDFKDEEYTYNYRDTVERALFAEIKSAMSAPERHARGYKGPSTNIKDPEFKRALMILKGFVTKSHTTGDYRGPDIHSGNIMVRRGPYAPQLVFTDPVV